MKNKISILHAITLGVLTILPTLFLVYTLVYDPLAIGIALTLYVVYFLPLVQFKTFFIIPFNNLIKLLTKSGYVLFHVGISFILTALLLNNNNILEISVYCFISLVLLLAYITTIYDSNDTTINNKKDKEDDNNNKENPFSFETETETETETNNMNTNNKETFISLLKTYQTKNEEGFTNEEIIKLVEMAKLLNVNVDMDKLYQQLSCNTCSMSEDNKIINYHEDTIPAIINSIID